MTSQSVLTLADYVVAVEQIGLDGFLNLLSARCPTAAVASNALKCWCVSGTGGAAAAPAGRPLVNTPPRSGNTSVSTTILRAARRRSRFLAIRTSCAVARAPAA